VQRTVCHVPFRGFFSLENIFRFVGCFSWQTAANARRWVAEPKSKTKYVFDSQSWFYVRLKNSKPFLAVARFQASSFGQYFFSKQVFKFSAFLLAVVSSLA
jgi:hypothetical protein